MTEGATVLLHSSHIPVHSIYNFIKNETLAQVFSCEFYKISKNNFFTEHLWATVSLALTEKQLKFQKTMDMVIRSFLYLTTSVIECGVSPIPF